MKRKLLIQACVKFAAGLLLVGCLLFLPAGTIAFWKGWLLMASLFFPMLITGIILWIKAPELLEKRLNSLLLFVCGFVTAGLDFRYGWSRLPGWVSVAAAVLLLLAYGMYGEAMRENTWLSRTVEVQQGQKVIDTGLYGKIRHPMYSAMILLFLSMPLVSGSVYAFLIFLIYPLLLIKRIKNEEAVLLTGLEGYAEYTRKVRYRLVPFIW